MERIILLSGLSGSGKTTAARALEDLGFFRVDNLPPELLFSFFDLCRDSLPDIRKITAVVDARMPDRGALSDFEKTFARIKKSADRTDLVFLECSDESMVRRYKETRRIHPLCGEMTLPDAIAEERRILSEIRDLADVRVDTSDLSVHDLREVMRGIAGETESAAPLLSFVSFGYRYGLPADADLVFDVRFLKNPYFTESLRDLDGTRKEVAEFVMSDGGSREFVERLSGFLRFLIPKYREEGKSYLTLALGCTGGKHRSVAVADALGKRFSEYSPVIRHRDVNKL